MILLAEELGCGKVVAAVAGGESRAESVRIGVGEVGEDAAVILVHDAARPLVSDEVIERLLAALNEGWDGAVPGLPLADTVKRVRGGAVVETLAARRARRRCRRRRRSSPRCCARRSRAEARRPTARRSSRRAAARVKVVEGDPRLLKVTTPDDLALVESWLDADA